MTTAQRQHRNLHLIAPVTKSKDPGRLVIRGLTAADLAALDRATVEANERIAAVSPGARTSRNAVALGLLREALKAYADRIAHTLAKAPPVEHQQPTTSHKQERRVAPIPDIPPRADASKLRPRAAPLDPSALDALTKLRETYALASVGAAAGVSEPTVRRALAGASVSPLVRRALALLAQRASQEAAR